MITSALNQDIVKDEHLYDRLGLLGLWLIIPGTVSQIIAALLDLGPAG
jgi:hypothetical protein